MSARPRTHETRRCRGSAGITMIELLMAIAITGAILVPIGSAIYFGLRTTSETQTRVTSANSANVLASYFMPDVQGAEEAGLDVPEPSDACGGDATTANLMLATSATTSVAYIQGGGGSATNLYRRTCSGGASTGISLVARSLAQPVQFDCDAGCSSVTVTIVQRDSNGNNEYQTRLEASKRASS